MKKNDLGSIRYCHYSSSSNSNRYIRMNRTLEILIVIFYNLTLLAGASYLVYYKDASAWLYFVAILCAASWKTEKEKQDERI